MEEEIKQLKYRVGLLEITIELLRKGIGQQVKAAFEQISCQTSNEAQEQGQGERGLDVNSYPGKKHEEDQQIQLHPDVGVHVKTEVIHDDDCDIDIDDHEEGGYQTDKEEQSCVLNHVKVEYNETKELQFDPYHTDFIQSDIQVSSYECSSSTLNRDFMNSNKLELEEAEINNPEVRIEEKFGHWAPNEHGHPNPNDSGDVGETLRNLLLSVPVHPQELTADRRSLSSGLRPYEKVFPCSYCGKTFGVRAKLNSHLKSHAETKNFVCTCCQKRFKTNGNLRSHFNQVHADRQIACSDCTKTFRNKKNLLYHIRTSHINERPFTCNFCSYRTAEKSYIRKHVWRRHREEFANFIKL